VIGLSVTKLRKVAESASKSFLSVNILASYKQESGCLVHFLRLSAVWWPGTQSVRVNNLLACIFAKYSPIFLKRQSRLFETEAVEFTSLANKNIGLSMSLLLHQLSTLAVKAVISGHLVQSVLTSYFRLFGSKAKTSKRQK